MIKSSNKLQDSLLLCYSAGAIDTGVAAGCQLSGLAGSIAAGSKPITGSPIDYTLLELRSRRRCCLELSDAV